MNTARMPAGTCELPTPRRELVEWALSFAQAAYELRLRQGGTPCATCGVPLPPRAVECVCCRAIPVERVVRDGRTLAGFSDEGARVMGDPFAPLELSAEQERAFAELREREHRRTMALAANVGDGYTGPRKRRRR